jgi:hypothetical protein
VSDKVVSMVATAVMSRRPEAANIVVLLGPEQITTLKSVRAYEAPQAQLIVEGGPTGGGNGCVGHCESAGGALLLAERRRLPVRGRPIGTLRCCRRRAERFGEARMVIK